MSTVEIKKSLIAKTITNLEADITRKGTWAYQNALALESILSSDKFVNDKVVAAKEAVTIGTEAKEVIRKDTKIVKFEKEFPNRSSENQYFKELSNGELIFFNRGSEKYVFISKDEGTTWEVLFDKDYLSQNNRTLGLETSYFDIEYVNGHYTIAWTGTSDNSEKINVGKIINNRIVNIEEISGSASNITDISVTFDSFNRVVVIYKANKVLTLSVKQNDGSFANVNINNSTADTTWYSRQFKLDDDGHLWLIQATDSIFAVTKVDLTSQSETPTVTFYREATGEAMSNESYFMTVWKGNTVLIVRYGRNALLFNTEVKEFVDTNINISSVNECIVVDKDFNLIYGRKYTTDLGKTWKVLPIQHTYLQTSMSNMYPNASTYKNYVVFGISDSSSTLNVQHKLVKIEDLLSNDEIIL